MHAEWRVNYRFTFRELPQTDCRDYSEVKTTINNRKELIGGSFRDDETTTKQSGSIATRRFAGLVIRDHVLIAPLGFLQGRGKM
jgi:hypothetical protein